MSHLIDATAVRAAIDASRPVRLLDVRWRLDVPEGRPAYLAAHLPGAVYVDLERDLSRPGHPEEGRLPPPGREQLQRAARRWGIDAGDLVVAYDDNDSVAAARAWWLLRPRGVDIRVLDGGLRAWVAQGYPIAAADVQPSPGDVVLGEDEPPTADIESTARAHISGALIDVRSAAHYRGLAGGSDPVAGHIPGAINLPTSAYIREDGTLEPPEVVRDALHRSGVDPRGPVVLYCGTGVASAHSALALATAGISATVYAGSWSQWARDRRRPVAVGPKPAGAYHGW
ncbi:MULTISPECIES: sulfurtransferase [unclassified Microbacterium]|uniref:sulfurtransferase n=1 Tax=unclassified Microbacterium TaxID=2609290 RepID=UPI00301B4975